MEKINYICPQCKHEGFKNLKKDYICDSCNSKYSIINKIPRFVDENNYSNSFGFQWNKFIKTQLDSYTGLPISKKRILKATGWDDLGIQEQHILEAGSGAGRFTEVLSKTKATLYSFDYSKAVEANFTNNGHSINLNIFQGSILEMPFKANIFDHVICLGVIQHTPKPEESFFNLSKVVKPGGQLTIDIYRKSWYHYIHWKYLLRPITKHINQEFLFKIITLFVPILIPFSKFFKFILGRFGARLIPIVEFSNIITDKKINKEWAILDTFDMYSPAHDHPKSKKEVKNWYEKYGFENITIFYGDNGIVARGIKK